MKQRRLRKEVKFGILILVCSLVLVLAYRGLHKEEPVKVEKVAEKDKVKPVAQKEVKHKIMLDAGHGGYDPGCISEKGTTEKKVALDVTLKAGKILESKGIDVEYTRKSDKITWESDNAADLIERSKMANDEKVELFISVHANFSDIDPEHVRGNEVWYSEKNKGSKKAAQLVLNSLAAAKYTDNRGLHSDAETPISVLYYNRMPSILVELGFLSNPQDEKIMASKEGQEKLAQALAQGILDYIETLKK